MPMPFSWANSCTGQGADSSASDQYEAPNETEEQLENKRRTTQGR